jgi:hypothetical protein
MRWSWLLAASLIPLLSGCTGTPSGQADAGDEPCLVESADDFTCLNAELNGTADERPHLHDYWGGRDRVALEDMTDAGSPSLCTGDNWFVIGQMLPADGESVFQGTSSVEVTLTFNEQELHEQPGETALFIKTAADDAPVFMKEIQSGEMFTLATTNAMNDLPHQMLSAWVFGLGMRSTGPTGCFDYAFEVTAHVEIVRGLDIPLYPGHPDKWDGATELGIIDVSTPSDFNWGAQGTCLNLPDGRPSRCLWEPHRPDNGTVVPFDAEQVTVTLSHVGGSPLRLNMAYHGAETREYKEVEPTSEQGAARTWLLPVEGNGDGPYATQSQWRFFFWGDNAQDFYSGEYSLKVTASKSA